MGVRVVGDKLLECMRRVVAAGWQSMCSRPFRDGREYSAYLSAVEWTMLTTYERS